jgi:Arc/MetJ family transcription regulator
MFACVSSNRRDTLFSVDDRDLIAKAEEALTEIKVAQGLSERHEAVLAALRIRLKGSAGKSLEEMLDAADDAEPDPLGEALAKVERKRKPSLDDLLSKEPKEKPDWPS